MIEALDCQERYIDSEHTNVIIRVRIYKHLAVTDKQLPVVPFKIIMPRCGTRSLMRLDEICT